jgi:ERCC4-type nuclease
MQKNLRIIYDSREQHPFDFSDYDCRAALGALSSGDYSLAGFESQVAVERKSLGDLIGCLTSGRERFTRELERLRGYDSCAVVVEASWHDLASGNYRSKLNPDSAVQSVISIMERFRMPFFFAGDRRQAEAFTYDFLRHYHRHALERYKHL